MPKGACKKLGLVHVGLLAALVFMIALAGACSSRKQPAKQQKTSTAAADTSPKADPSSGSVMERDGEKQYTVVEARHVIFHEQSGIRLRAEWLQGRLYPTCKDVTPSLDNPTSFKVEIEEGEMRMSLDDLSRVLREGVFKGCRLSGVRLRALGRNELQISGMLHELVPLPVRLTGEIGATEDGRISVHIERVEVLKIPFKKVLGLLRMDPASLLHATHAKGVEAQGDSVYLRTDELLPAPRKTGDVTSVHFADNGDLFEDYGHHSQENPAIVNWNRGRWRNYIRLTGGRLHFGKLTMDSADLTLLDTSPGDWFEFDLARYRQQIASGEMRMTPAGGLLVFVPDITKLHLRQKEPAAPGPVEKRSYNDQ